MIGEWFLEILMIQLASAWFMAGLIWFVQLVHYPLMLGVGEADWPIYERIHQRRTTRIVAPVMLIELLSAELLLTLILNGTTDGLVPARTAVVVRITAAFLALAWISTFAVEVRLHKSLSKNHDARLLQCLVTTNWVRTGAWSGRAMLLTSILF